jgi:hypothetical protein
VLALLALSAIYVTFGATPVVQGREVCAACDGTSAGGFALPTSAAVGECGPAVFGAMRR